MAWDAETLTTIASTNILESQDLYPHATVFSDHNATLNPWLGTTVLRLSDEVPKTSKDMSNMFKWEHGDKVRGTHAQEDEAFKEYRKDINKAYGKEKEYRDIFIDTLRPNIGKRLKELKK